ncbi:hypothetical protein FO436_06530 [Weissella cibaria]|uniref:hypothetical protein n=1 Tax=Weissella cibaria TaxID=137591 RepID=UPI00118F6073|nr:hypothetical protein [Weissella cibaria]TVV34267.1 hypothetical protein FO436_06530 [Weissella cibaria]
MSFVYKDREISKEEAERILSEKSSQKLINLLKMKKVSGDFPFSFEQWQSLAFANTTVGKVNKQLEFIKDLPVWARQYLVDLNTVRQGQKQGFGLFRLYLDKIIDGGEIKFNDFMDLWDRFIISSAGPEILVSNRLSIQVAKEILSEIDRLDQANINLRELFDLIHQNKRYTTHFENRVSEKRTDVEMVMVKLLKTDWLDESRPTYNRSEYSKNVRSIVSGILKKTVTFDFESYEKYKLTWNFVALDKSLTDSKIQKKQNNTNVVSQSRTRASQTVETPRVNINRQISSFFKGKKFNADFPFSLIRWMEFGQQLANGKRNLAKRSAEIQEISKVLPKYAEFLTSNVGIFDSYSSNQHSEAWKKAQQNGKAKAKKTTNNSKQGYAFNFSYSNDGVIDHISVQRRSTVEPPVRTKRKSKIIATTGVAGVIGGKKPQPVTKKQKDKIAPKASQKKKATGADVKIMDRLFWHREVPHSENFSKPGFQLKTA